MNRGEFLSVLRQSLEGCIPMEEVESNLAFYQNYFEESPKKDWEIIEELGDPHLIARTIIDAYRASKGPMADYYMKQAEEEYRREHSRKYDDEVPEDDFLGRFGKSFPWLEKLLFWFIMLVIVLVFFFAARFFIVYALPIIMVVIIIKILFDYFNR